MFEEGGAYVGGTYRYVDSVDVDEISMFELGSMLEEGFGHLGYCDFYYKMPNVDGLCLITKDADVVNMCAKIDPSRMVYMYAVTVSIGETQDFYPSQQTNLQFLDIPNLDGMNDDEIDDMLLERIAQPYDRSVLKAIDSGHVEKTMEAEIISDGEEGSFHEDSSNIDSTDEEVSAVKEKNKEK